VSAATLNVALGARSYPIEIGTGLIARAGALLRPHLPGPRVIVVSDRHVAAAGWTTRLAAGLDAGGIGHATVLVEPGEASKGWAGLQHVVESILAQRPDRKTAVVALGGGVIGDLAGFAAAVTLRGLPFVQIPTSLLAQVDSSVGGKTGINSALGKNLIGAFHQPRAVLIDTATLATLPPRELRAGYAEIVKHGLIADAELLAWLEARGTALLAGDDAAAQHAIRRSCEIKAAVVERDEHETLGLRATLNFGHTFGHAYEALCGYSDRLLHGEAVALGLVQATELSVRLGLLDPAATGRVRDHLAASGLAVDPTRVRAEGFPAEAMLAAMGRDKKAEGGTLAFVLLRRVGEAFLSRTVPLEVVRPLLDSPA
jgi:3-dehydroquinate synthase